MRISYDAKVDALYMKFIPGHHQVDTKLVDDWIALDFDARDRLVGIEVLDASKRLELSSLLPLDFIGDFSGIVAANGDGFNEASSDWEKLKHRLAELKQTGTAVETNYQRRKNLVEEIATDYVTMKREATGNIVPITRSEFEEGTKESLTKKRKWSITQALRNLVVSD